MYRDDYIIRMATQFGQILAYVLGLARDGQSQLALIAIDNALRQLLGIGSLTLTRMSTAQALALIRLGDGDETWRERGAYVAALLNAEADICSRREQYDLADERRLTALQLLLEVRLGTDPDTLPAYTPQVADLAASLRDVHLPAATLAALLHYYEATGAFAAAEDALFELLASEPANRDLRDVGLAFYERLRQRDDADLTAGNLPRAEVEAGHAELEARQYGT